MFDGRIIKNDMTGLSWTISENHWTAKVSIFDGRVAKSRGSRNSLAESLAARGSDVNPAARSHPSSRAGGQDDVSSKQTPSNDGASPLA